ncbi:uncharacterized protein LAESUDRAFT_199541 [Laetiporus sulphureus 93-53]|uniref:Uncharacterized protein n=1 Tax=Laetiporus sulphureus 93-53 TaxID=1314785 RepID=A0A165E2S8_9APHY|nr:uncharacterized protein LAESUDRAFT_199541 [Laetiporus sulphureus 93-53]KZT06137.1 hypothetical protein LAESUDRAFT_199541 [Laetiporus sulphureus 93-53]
MTAPTQVLPSWLTLSTTVITEPDGSLSTSSATLQLPLTYYGPSIPLNSDWTWGGLTSPGPTSTPLSTASPHSPSLVPPTAPTTALSSVSSSTSTAASTALSSAVTSTSMSSSVPSSSTAIIISSSSSISSTLLSSTATSASSRTSSASSSASSSPTVIALANSSGISVKVLGAVLGSIIGALLLIIALLVWLLLRKYNHDIRPADEASPQESSFWNRETTLLSRRSSRRKTPIWTEWQVVSPDEAHEEEHENVRGDSPGEGSPRGSGDEGSPFLTRQHTHDESNDMTQGSDTLMDPPSAALTSGSPSSRHSDRKLGGPIIPRGELLARMRDEQHTPTPMSAPGVRIVRPSPRRSDSPPLPAPFANFDERHLGRGMHHAESPSMSSTMQGVSFSSEKSTEKSSATLGDPNAYDPPDLLSPKRINISSSGPSEDEAGPSSSFSSSPSGLGKLANLPRMSWFKRLSSPKESYSATQTENDPPSEDTYTRTPSRHSRNGSRSRPDSRPVSWAPLPTHEPTSPEAASRRQTRLAVPGLGLTVGGVRPTSSVSASGRSGVSGNTVSAQSGPRDSGSDSQQDSVSTSYGETPRSRFPGGFLPVPDVPPSYEDSQSEMSRGSMYIPQDAADVLDFPVPRPASPFTAVSGRIQMPQPQPYVLPSIRPDSPPGPAAAMPNPRAWRNSHATDGSQSSSAETLEDEPPRPQRNWRSLATDSEGRRMTFGVPLVVHPHDAVMSEQGSLHSRLGARSPLSPPGSHPASVLTGSGSSSGPSTHSRGFTGSSSSGSVSEDGRRRRQQDPSDVSSPPISAVFNREGSNHSSRPASPLYNPPRPPMTPIEQSPDFPAANLPEHEQSAPVSGTITSQTTSRTENSNTHSSVTTTQTDPITGTTMHFPAMPSSWRQSGTDWRRSGTSWRRSGTSWRNSNYDQDAMW